MPVGGLLSVKDGRIPYHVLAARTPAETPLLPGYLDFETREPANEVWFITAVVPARTATEAEQVIGQMFQITGENFNGVRVERGNETDLVMFSTRADSDLIRQAEWSATASVLAVTSSGRELRSLAAQNARVVTHATRRMFSAEGPVSIAVNYATDRIDAVVSSKAETKVLLRVGTKPVRILMDGNAIAGSAFGFDASAGTITISVPSGRHEIRMDLK
jgi:hypothetical protein